MKCDMCGSTAVDHTEKVCAKNQANIQKQIDRVNKLTSTSVGINPLTNPQWRKSLIFNPTPKH